MRTKLLLLGALLSVGWAGARAQTRPWTYQSTTVGLAYEYEHYDVPTTSNWHYGSLFGSIGLGGVVLVPQLNWGDRIFAGNDDARRSGLQLQMDLYPKLSKHFYLFASYGYSASDVFARHRAALELYGSTTNGWELSAGGRYVLFGSVDVATYTVSVGKYWSRWWVMLRLMGTDQSTNAAFQPAAQLTARMFGKRDERNYVQLQASYGFSADEVTYYHSASLSDLLHSASVGLSIKQAVAKRVVLIGGLSYRWEEFRDRDARNVLGAQAGVLFRF